MAGHKLAVVLLLLALFVTVAVGDKPPVTDLYVDPEAVYSELTASKTPCSAKHPCSSILQALAASPSVREGTFRLILAAGTYTGPDNLKVKFNDARLEGVIGAEAGSVVVDGESQPETAFWTVTQTADNFVLANIEFRRMDVTGHEAPVSMVAPSSNSWKKWAVSNLRFASNSAAEGMAGGLFVDMLGGNKHDRFVAENIYFADCSARLAGGAYIQVNGGTMSDIVAQSCTSLGGNSKDGEFSAGGLFVQVNMEVAATGAPAMIMTSLHAYECILDGDPNTVAGAGGIMASTRGKGFMVLDSVSCIDNQVVGGDPGAKTATHFMSRTRQDASMKMDYLTTQGGAVQGSKPSLPAALVLDGCGTSYQTIFSATLEDPHVGVMFSTTRAHFVDSTVSSSTSCGVKAEQCFGDKAPVVDRVAFNNCEQELCCDDSCDALCNPPEDNAVLQ